MKKKMHALSTSLKYSVEDKLRYLCSLISTDSRLVIIIVLLLAGVILNFYFMFSTINNWSKKKENINIEHMNTPDIQNRGKVEQLKPYEYDQTDSTQADE